MIVRSTPVKGSNLAEEIREIVVDPLLERVAEEPLVRGAAVGAQRVQRVSEGVHGVADKVLVVLERKECETKLPITKY